MGGLYESSIHKEEPIRAVKTLDGRRKIITQELDKYQYVLPIEKESTVNLSQFEYKINLRTAN